ncbi:MAG: DUF2786 domain-containing protein [Nannocystaceae bacterium]
MTTAIHDRLRSAWLTELRRLWHELNDHCLAGRLRPPVFHLDRVRDPEGRLARLGHWEREARILSVAEAHIWEHPWDEVVATLKHEMAHQYVDEVLGGGDRPHGPEFAGACALLGVSSRASAALDPAALAARAEIDRVLARVRKLLALAESANQHEAANAMAAAQTLLLRYNLEIPPELPRGYEQRRVGPSAAVLAIERKLIAAILSEFFFVECIWVSTYNARRLRSERVLELLGTPANLAMAEYVEDFLRAEIERLWEQARGDRRLPRAASRRREFVAGVLLGLRDKLRAQRDHCAEVGLVWVGDPDLRRFVRERHPHLRSLAGGGIRRSREHEAGREAGAALTLRRPVEETRPSRGLQLPPARGRSPR